jgi:heavy metal translocating P-type ATPase
MNEELQVFQRGRGRACVTGARKDSAEANALEAWLAERIDVACFEQRIGTGTFYVEYDDGAALSGRFIRSLRDKIHTLNRTKPEPFNIKPVHSLRGRVRLEVTGISERQLATLTMLSTGLPGVKRTKHRPGSRTTLVVYDPEKASEGFIRERLLKSNPDEWTREWHKPTPIRWGGALGGTSTLIACLTGAALSMLMRRREQEALRVLPDGGIETVPVSDLQAGDHFIVHAGHGIVADGKVVTGLAEVDAAALTGESRLLPKKEGDPVFASTFVAEGHLVVEVERSGKNTEAAKIERILNTVGSKPLTLQREALDVASKLVLPTFGIAWLAAALSSDVDRAVCVLITDFGTGFRIAVPTSALTAMTLAAREGVLVKGAQYLERLSKTDVIIFDKTGTLTRGVPEVVKVVPARGEKKSTLITLSASVEARHDHPVARALKAYAREQDIGLIEPEPGNEEYAVGLGLSARVRGRRVRVGRATWMESQQLEIGLSLKKHLDRFKKDGNSSLCVAVDEEVIGLVAYSDRTRPESAAIVQRLRGNGRRRIVLLSGDSPEVVQNVARAVGIDEAVGGLLPEQKAEYVRKLRAAGCVVAMVGDGINDAPALASADVGISFAGSADVALETADVVLLDRGLVGLEKAFQIGDRAISSVRQNLGIIIVPNAIAIALGACGLIAPPMAAIINNGATFLAVLAATIPLLKIPARHPRPGIESSESELTSTTAYLPDAPASTIVSRRSLRLLAARADGKDEDRCRRL